MDLKRAFQLSTYLLVLTGVLSLALAEGSPVWVFLAGAAATVAHIQADRRGRPLGRAKAYALALGAFGFLALDVFFLSGESVLGLSHFLILVALILLASEKSPREYFWLFAISLMHLAVAAVFTVDVLFALAFVLYMVLGTWALILFLLVREREASDAVLAGAGGAPSPPVRIGRGFLAGVGAVSLLTLLMTAVLFAVFPRIGQQFFQVRRSGGPRVTGFSTEVGLSDLSAIRESREEVMRVVVDRPGLRFPAGPRWRGLAYDRYERGRWVRSWLDRDERDGRRGPPVPPILADSALGRFYTLRSPTGEPDWPARAEDVAVCTVYLAPIGVDVLFVPQRPRTIEFLSRPPQFLAIDPGGGVEVIGHPQTDLKYQVRSVPVRRSDVSAGPGSRVPEAFRAYVRYPRQGPDMKRIEALAQRVAADAGATTDLARVEAIERHLRETFEYTLEVEPSPTGVDPIEHFLFDKKRGHCELFASAFVLMVRALKDPLPSRLVSGFLSGEWNDVGRYWLVRQSDAHAWAEVYFPSAGWVEFDPTPAGAELPDSGLFGRLSRFADYMKLRWLNYVISYDLKDQISLAEEAQRRMWRMKRAAAERLERARATVASFRARLESGALGARAWLRIAAVAVAIAALAVLAFIFRRRLLGAGGSRRARVAGPAAPVVRFYADLVKVLERRGFIRGRTETPREYALRVVREGGPMYEPVPAVVDSFYRARYGGVELGLADVAAAEGAVRRLVLAASPGPGPKRAGPVAAPPPVPG